MRTHTRLARWALLCGLVAACADGGVEPAVVRDESPVATDSSTYHLLSQGASGSETYAFSGTATFRNVTNRILYVADDCFGPSMHLERAGGDIVPMDAPICVDDAPPPGPAPLRTAIAPGDSIRVPFSFSTAQRSAPADAAAITGAVRLVFDVDQHVFGNPQPEPVSREFATSDLFTISLQ